jgi:type I restriction enzyme M protein
MAKRASKQDSLKQAPGNGGNLGFEQKLWQAADKMRGHMDASEYKHVALGLIFLKYISDAFEVTHRLIAAGEDDLAKQFGPGDPEERSEYEARSVFWIPPESRWSHLQKNAKQTNVGQLIDDAMVAIEHDNPNLKGVLPKNYNSRDLDRHRLGELIDLIGTITLTEAGNDAARSRDILGRVYEYFLGQFAEREGKSGGEFYTPQSVVKLLVEMIEPYKGRVFDPCCGSGGMFVQSEKFVLAHGGRIGDIAVYGQESNPTTWKLARLNLAIRGIDANLGPHHADSFHRDLHPDLKADYILANPPFNMSDWGGARLREDKRWQYGVPPAGNANYAWVQHFIHHLAPTGIAGFVMANGSMSSTQSGEGEIRQRIVEADLVDCMIALPGQLFYTTPIPVCLWFLTRDKAAKGKASGAGARNRRGQTLFIDARKMGTLIDRTHRELSEIEITRIVTTYHAWRGEKEAGGFKAYADTPGFCKSATLDDIRGHSHMLTPGRYVGAEDVEDDGEPFDEKMAKLVAQLEEQFEESARLEKRIRSNLQGLGHVG